MNRKLLKSLLKATAYPEPTASVRLIETHVSHIFISDHYVYKVKKPVDFGFLNFTTLDRRRFYCEEEVRLNRRLCPDTYLGVVELRQTEQGGSFAAPGEVVDYAVKMKRLPEERMLSRLLDLGEVDAAQMRELALVIAAFHGRAATGPQIESYGRVSALRSNWEENFRQVAEFRGDTIPAPDLALLRGWVEGFLARNEELFRSRVAGGFIRECDGDLHSGNICMTEPICIFDCIEFNERFRCIDTAADIAFLLMDLEYAGRPDLCTPFLERYREATGDSVPLPLLAFYQANRAFVRGKVLSLRLKEPGVDREELSRVRDAARRYFRLARGYPLRERLPPSLILTCGLMGSGKSAVARELSRELGVSCERSDVVRKSLAGEPLSGRTTGERSYDDGIYGADYNRQTYQALLKSAQGELEGGRSVIIDATFRRRGDREEFRSLAAKMGAKFHLLETRCPENIIKERLERRLLDPDEVSDGRWEIYPLQAAEFEAPAPGESIVLDSARPLCETVDKALEGMGLLP
jgi:uncharacterized protein